MCIERRPRCGTSAAPTVPEPLSEIGAIVGTVVGIVGGIGGVIGFVSKEVAVVDGTLVISGISIGGAAAAGGVAAFVAGMAVLIVVGMYAVNRCTRGEGLAECVAGVVIEIVESFSDAIHELFPFTAVHDRVDVVVKSRYWDVVEDGNAFVFCTNEAYPRRSEIMRCYFREQRLCDIGQGAIVGTGIGVVAGVIAGALTAAAIGCSSVVGCIVVLIIAALIAAVAALVGAFVGGQAVKASSPDVSPTADTGVEIAVGDYLTLRGNMQRREYDTGANVLWWVDAASPHGRASSDLPRPFSYCDVNQELTMDSCPTVPEP